MKTSIRRAGKPLLFTLCGVLMLQTPSLAQQVQRRAGGPAAGSTPPSPQLDFPGDSVLIPSTFDGRHTFVKGSVDGFDDLEVIIDSGAGANLIDPAVAEAMGLEQVSEMTVMSGGTDPITAGIVIVPEFMVGDLTVRDASFLALQMPGDIDAILGMPTFSNHLLSYDPAHGLVVVAVGALSESDPDVVRFTQTASIQVPITVNDRTIRVTLDTGSGNGLTLPYEMKDSVRLTGPLEVLPDARLVGGTRSSWLGTLDGSLHVAGLTYVNPKVWFMDPASSGNIGGQILKDARLTIDQQNGLLALRPYPDGMR